MTVSKSVSRVWTVGQSDSESVEYGPLWVGAVVLHLEPWLVPTQSLTGGRHGVDVESGIWQGLN